GGLQGERSDAGGGKPNTVNAEAGGGTFIYETIGYTAPQGKIQPGVYDIVYDECQDGKLGLNDALFEKALTVTAGPVDAPPIPNLALMKAAAKKFSEGLQKVSKRVEAVM